MLAKIDGNLITVKIIKATMNGYLVRIVGTEYKTEVLEKDIIR